MSWRQNKLNQRQINNQGRIKFLAVFFIIFCLLIIIKLFDLQILRGDFYTALAFDQHELYQQLFPERGSIYIVDANGGEKTLFPLVTNQELMMLYAVPKDVENPKETAEKLAEILGLPDNIDIERAEEKLFADISSDLEPKMIEEIKAARRQKWLAEQKELEIKRLTEILAKENDPYEPIRHRLSDEQVAAIEDLAIKGLAFKEETWRFYPEAGMGGHLFGFWGFEGDERQGQYGLEGYFNEILSGQTGEIYSEQDVWGNIIAIGQHSFKKKIDGSDLVLTLDRAIQFKACEALTKAVNYFKAAGGSIIVVNPQTGAILAMCGAPDYNPDQYNKVEDIEVYNNPAIFLAYEPGSIFKPITMAAALDTNNIEPTTTYEDTGKVVIGKDTISNFGKKSYGRQTMTEVLERSINTGAVYAMEQTTSEVFVKYVKDFGFGGLTGIELDKEVAGDISNLDKKGKIYAATASYGQGIMVTPLQMIMAVSALANGGKLMKPYLISQIIDENNKVQSFGLREIKQVVSSKTAAMVGGMMVSVVENGFGKAAGVKGYRVAGKTGTAQVANKNSRGYSSEVITSFVGFAPFSDPKFAMIVRIDKPQWGKTGEVVAAPVFHEVAKFILQYYNVPYDK